MTRTLSNLDPSQLRPAAGVLARAFRDNPGTLALMRGCSKERRLELNLRVAWGLVRCAHRYGIVTGAFVDSRLVGVSLAFAPGTYPPPILGQLLMALGPLSTGPRMARRYALIDQHMRRHHLHRPHYYLSMLGVEPDEQGRGHGSALLKEHVALADRDHVDCYLETDKPESVRLYEGFGYAVTREDVLRELSDLRFWTMTRGVR